MQFGEGKFVYQNCENWGSRLFSFQDEFRVKKVSDIGVDTQGRIFLLNRSSRPIIISDANGNYIAHWEIPGLGRPHEICFDTQGYIYITDDEMHVVYKLDQNGKVVMKLGKQGVPSDTGYEQKDYRTIKQAAGPFNRPTGVSVADDGRIYISDGYGNARVHVFDPNGTHLKSWGEPGFQPGQFFLPHGILVNEGTVYVADRENGRVQLFDLDGNFKTEWRKIYRPSVLKLGPEGLIYICECKHDEDFTDPAPSRFCIMTKEGELVARLDTPNNMQPFVQYHGAHGMAVDEDGNVYVGEVGDPIDNYLCVKKYLRIR